MKNYVKPMVVANDGLAEGVYMASGDGCFQYLQYSGETKSTGDGYYEYNVEFQHSAEAHMNCTHKLTIFFDAYPQDASCVTNCSDLTISGNSVTVTWAQQQANGAGEHGDVGIKVKWSGDIVGKPTGGYGWKL